MSVELYETMVLFDSTRIAAEGDAIRAAVQHAIEKLGGHVDVSRPWDERKIAYPIRKQKKGTYHCYYYRLESTKQAELEREFHLNENVLRQMTLRVDPKWADAIMEIARNETSHSFAYRGMHDETAIDSNLGPNDPAHGGLPPGDLPPGGPPPRRRRMDGDKPE